MFGKAAMSQTVEAIINAQGHLQWLGAPIVGPHRVLITILETPATSPQVTDTDDFELPTLHFGAWPQDLSLRRDDMYHDDGR